MAKNNGSTRREFLKRTGGKAASLGLAAGYATVHAAKPVTAASARRVIGANDRVRIGVIGTGGRGGWFIKEARKQGADVVAVCDVCTIRLNQGKRLAGGEPFATDEYLRLLDRNDIDGVNISTPDHWHHNMLLDAVKAGKDVYIEKPLSKTIEEGKSMVKAVRATDCIVQVGNHRRSGDHWLRAKEVIESGKLGKITWVRVFDTRNWSKNDPFGSTEDIRDKVDWKKFIGPAPWHEFDAHRYFAWRWYWDYAGGLMTDIGAHQLDVVQWLMGRDGPKRVAANGGNYFFDYWETPDVVHSVLDYDDFCAVFSVGFLNDQGRVGGEFYGTDATLVVADKFSVYPQGGRRPREALEEWPNKYEGPAHVANFLDCIRTRKEPNSPIETGHRVITAAHLGNISYRSGKRVGWDAAAERML